MTSRGPIRQPDSVRGIREGIVTPSDPEAILPPEWLKKRKKVLEIFHWLVAKATEANVPMKQVDAEWFGVAAQCTLDYRNAKTAQDRARIGRDMEKFYATLGLHTMSRARMGIRDKAKGQSKTAKLLSMVGGRPEQQQSS